MRRASQRVRMCAYSLNLKDVYFTRIQMQMLVRLCISSSSFVHVFLPMALLRYGISTFAIDIAW